ncbi:hypothetical protein JW707_03265 [Candidatus Woesearchaeota archaeon]|nr:hypothetical protein [Candidatus Woesearchaeota archaeon]
MALCEYKYSVIDASLHNALCLFDSNALWFDFRKFWDAGKRKQFKKDESSRLSDGEFDYFLSGFCKNEELFRNVYNLVITPEIREEFEANTIPALEMMVRESLDTHERVRAFSDASAGLVKALDEKQVEFLAQGEARCDEIRGMIQNRIPYQVRRRVSGTDRDLLAKAVVLAETFGPVAVFSNDVRMMNILPDMQGFNDAGELKLKYPVGFYTTIGLDKRVFTPDHFIRPKEKGYATYVFETTSPYVLDAIREKRRERIASWMKRVLPHAGYEVAYETPTSLAMKKSSHQYKLNGVVYLGNSPVNEWGLEMAAAIVHDNGKIVECEGYLGHEKCRTLGWAKHDITQAKELSSIITGLMEAFLSGATRDREIKRFCAPYRRKVTRQNNSLPVQSYLDSQGF